jgi:hypothetical protein
MTPVAIAGGLILGMVIGIISGMIGIGGGAFLIPALIFFYRMSQKSAQGAPIREARVDPQERARIRIPSFAIAFRISVPLRI